jgi:beta-mannosidase
MVLVRTANMHRTYRIPVAGALRSGANTLAVTFRAPVPAAEEASVELGARPFVNTHPYNAVRKVASNYGWDWGPDVATVGIWRPLYVESWSTARIAAVRPLVDVDATTGVLRAHVDVRRADGDDAPLRVDVAVSPTEGSAGRVTGEAVVEPGADTAVVELRVPDVRLWWPHGYGGQDRYEVSVTLAGPAGRLDGWHGRVGFRTVGLDTTPDPDGTPFTLSVNGMPVFARGVNWIPDDAFPTRVTAERYRERLTQARDANVNLVRVWGGGSYESHDFYAACDELGLLVWQDFALACAAYAEEEPLRAEVVAEAREAVTRLSRYPSLVLWNGGNENIQGYHDWGWQEPLAGRSWGWGYYAELLPAIVAELDPSRPYSPGSPYSFAAELPPNDPAHGTVHIWDVWNRLDYTAYRSYQPRFVAEFGFQGPPTWATLTRAIHDDPLRPDSPGMLAHQKAADGSGKLARGLSGHLPEPESFDDWHWATSLNQARALTYGIEHFRSLAPLCMGTVVWQLNDMWPVTSWAAVDGDGRRKPLWYALRRSFRDRLLTIQPRPGGLALVAVNDSAAPWAEPVEVTRRDFAGTVLASANITVSVAARGTATYLLPPDLTGPGDPTGEILLAEGADRAWWHFVEDVAAALPPAQLDATVEPVPDGYRLTVTAGTFTRDLAVLADRVSPDAYPDDQLVTLLPGESATFLVCTGADVPPERFADPLVLRSANQLVAGRTRRSADRCA